MFFVLFKMDFFHLSYYDFLPLTPELCVLGTLSLVFPNAPSLLAVSV